MLSASPERNDHDVGGGKPTDAQRFRVAGCGFDRRP
jgi:hypothetical protein